MHSLIDPKRREDVREAVKKGELGKLLKRSIAPSLSPSLADDIMQAKNPIAISYTDDATEEYPTSLGISVRMIELIDAIRAGDIEGVKMAVSNGADILVVCDTDIIARGSGYCKWYKENALGMAMRYGNAAIISYLRKEAAGQA